MSEITIGEAEAALKTAVRHEEAVEIRIREALRRATAEVKERYRDELSEASSARSAASKVLTAAKDRAPAHPWDGRKVYKMVQRGRIWNRQPPKRVEGVVETRRSDTRFPVNTARYRLPEIGEGFVRLLKADGSPGAKFERLWDWKLVEGETAAA